MAKSKLAESDPAKPPTGDVTKAPSAEGQAVADLRTARKAMKSAIADYNRQKGSFASSFRRLVPAGLSIDAFADLEV